MDRKRAKSSEDSFKLFFFVLKPTVRHQKINPKEKLDKTIVI